MLDTDQLIRHIDRGARNLRSTHADIGRLVAELPALAVSVASSRAALSEARQGIDPERIRGAELRLRSATRSYWSAVLDLALAQADVCAIAFGAVPLSPDIAGIGWSGADLALLGNFQRACRDLARAHQHPRAGNTPSILPEGVSV